jgi:DNA gyrase subunit B
LVGEVAKRLDVIAEETERGWEGSLTSEGGLRLERMVRGVKEVVVARHGADRIPGRPPYRSDVVAPQGNLSDPPTLKRRDGALEISGARALLDAILQAAARA